MGIIAISDLRVDASSGNPYGSANCRVPDLFSWRPEMHIVETQELVPSCHRPEIVETSELQPTCHS